MNPIFDTALLRHHHVDYGKRIDTNPVKRSVHSGRTFIFVIVAVISVGFATGIVA